MKYYTGIDIGSTASKVVVLDDEKIVNHFVLPTGWSSKETSAEIARRLEADGMPINEEMKVIATGYGRVAVDYAAKTVGMSTALSMFTIPVAVVLCNLIIGI